MSHLAMFRNARLDEWWERLLVELRRAVDAITVKELAHALDVAPSYVVDALKGADRKHVKAEWLPTILMLCPPSHRQALLEAIAIPAGYYVQARPQMTPEQELEHLRRAVGRMAPAVLEMADKEMGK